MTDDALPIAALEHFAYCERQWALIHLDRFFEDDDNTMRGHHVHERVDLEGSVLRSGIRTEWRLPVWSDELGLFGYCDAVEFSDETVLPIEYKSGSRFGHPAEIQVCAQAMCLEEMLQTEVPLAVIYTAKTRRRTPVELTAQLREEVRSTIEIVRKRREAPTLPPPRNDERCSSCSLAGHCLPELVSDRRRTGGLRAGTWKM